MFVTPCAWRAGRAAAGRRCWRERSPCAQGRPPVSRAGDAARAASARPLVKPARPFCPPLPRLFRFPLPGFRPPMQDRLDRIFRSADAPGPRNPPERAPLSKFHTSTTPGSSPRLSEPRGRARARARGRARGRARARALARARARTRGCARARGRARGRGRYFALLAGAGGGSGGGSPRANRTGTSTVRGGSTASPRKLRHWTT